MRRIRVGGLDFVGDNGRATYTIERDSMRGWLLDGVDMRSERVERPVTHGAFQMPGYLTGRSISWSGLVLTETPFEQDHALRRLSGLLADGGTGRLVVENVDPGWIDVQRDGEFDMKMRAYGRVASYRVQFWAANPRIYGEVRNFSAGQAAYHYGNFPATPRLLVGAGSGGYTITGPGGRLVTVNSNAPSGAHSIDFVTGGLFNSAGGRVANAITVYQPWKIAPGATASVSITGSRSLAQRVADTFI